jgi:subtilisin family serine protease
MAEMTASVYLNTSSQPTDALLDNEWFLAAANVLPVWRDYTGLGVSVGVFDPSGNIDFSSPDLVTNAGSSVKIDGTPGTQQTGTHATLVAGVIGAAMSRAGAVGVAPGVTLNSEAIGTAANAVGSGPDINDSNLMDWSKYAVVNNSFTNTPPLLSHFLNGSSGNTEVDALSNAAANGRGGLGTAVVVGGGNSRATGDNTNYNILTTSQYAIVVGGIHAPSDLGFLQISGAPFSDPGASILVSAPANQITSTGITYTNAFGQQFGADYQTAAGTSFATPIVAGVVALMLQANPKLGWRDIQEILAYSATEVDPAGSNWSYNGASNWNGGGLHASDDYGFGEVNALAAVRLAETWQDTRTSSNEHTYSLTVQPLTIPLSNGQYVPLNFTQFIQGVRFDVEHADVTLNLQNAVLADLIVKLVGPSGEISTLFNGPTASATLPNSGTPQSLTWSMDTVKDWGEQGFAAWQLYVYYAPGTNPGSGTVSGGALSIDGGYAPNGNLTDNSTPAEKTYVYTDEFGSLRVDPNNGLRGTLNDAGAHITLNAAAVTTGSTIDLTPGSTDSMIGGRALTISAATHVTDAIGGDGNDTLIASATNVTLQGDRGNDTYQFSKGFGQDTIINGWTTNTGPSGQIILGPGLDPGNLWLTQSGNNLLVQILGTTSQITVKGWYANSYAQLQGLTLVDGYQLTTAEIASLATLLHGPGPGCE